MAGCGEVYIPETWIDIGNKSSAVATCSGVPISAARDQEEQDLRIELVSAPLDQIRFEMEQARRDFEADTLTRAERARQEHRRFIVQMIVTSIAGVTAAVALILHLLGRV